MPQQPEATGPRRRAAADEHGLDDAIEVGAGPEVHREHLRHRRRLEQAEAGVLSGEHDRGLPPRPTTRLTDGVIDPLRPDILPYAPKGNGRVELVAVEYFEADADQNLATDGDRPTLLGQRFDGPMPGHNPTMPIHSDLHAWVAESNPSGVFFQTNSSLSCS